MKRGIVLAGLLFVNLSCVDRWLGPSAGTSPEEIYEAFWGHFDKYYGLFEVKNINWDVIYNAYRSRINESTSYDQLFDTMCLSIAGLRDGHVELTDGVKKCDGAVALRNDWPPDDYGLPFVNVFITGGLSQAAEGRILYGRMEDIPVGYIAFRHFSGGGAPVGDWVNEIDAILDSMADTEGLILDVRSNSGGNGFNGVAMAGRFTDESYPFMVSRTRNGAGRHDFTAPRTWHVNPEGGTPYLKPILILTNRYTFSAAEWFVMAMRTRPHVTVMGDLTGGGFSSRIFRELPNSWVHSISIQDIRDTDDVSYEGTGLTPDLYVNPIDPRFTIGDRILSQAENWFRDELGQ